MECREVNKKIKLFLDDLLAEEDYQDIWSHLDSCRNCGGTVRSLSTLGNQLWKLCAVKAPSDLASTILFRVKEAREHPAPVFKPASKSASKRLALIVAVMICLAAPAAFFLMRNQAGKRASEVKTLAASVETPILKEARRDFVDVIKPVIAGATGSADDRDAETLVKEYFGIDANAGKTAEKQTTGTAEELPLTAEPARVHLHFPYSNAKQVTQLRDTVDVLGIKTRRAYDELLVLSSKGKQLNEFINGLHSISGASGLYGMKSEPRVELSKGEKYECSVYLFSETSEAAEWAHWHIQFTPDSWNRFRQSLEGLGARVDYEGERALFF